MDENKDCISYLAFESVCARFERTIKRLWILLIIMLIMFGCSVYTIGYLLTEYQKETTTIEATQDGSDVNIVGGGDVNYGAESEGN